MNKSELIAALTEKAELASKKDAEKVLNAFVEVVTESLTKGEKVQLIGFGTFDVKSRPARKARNPRTGEEIKIAASKAPGFKAGKALKDKVNTPAKKKGKK
ncbi:MAG: HU family DNA-binding protein [Clostridia bacterium]|nr:HU family DNA-binding protein [Clostridia bacterium]